MSKYYKKKYYYRGSRDKYSIEQTVISGSLTPGQTTTFGVVPSTPTQGMRKVKHLTVSLSALDVNDLPACEWALVYVPAGTTVGGLSATNGSAMYEPNQFVMNCGVFDFNAGPIRVHSPVSRNLNSGDSVYLCLLPLAGTIDPSTVRGIVRYAVTYN